MDHQYFGPLLTEAEEYTLDKTGKRMKQNSLPLHLLRWEIQLAMGGSILLPLLRPGFYLSFQTLH